jgi:hypothetical protein
MLKAPPIVLDLYCGLGGWAEGLQAAGWRVIGMDIDPRFAGRYPGQLILQDALTFDGRRARGRVALCVASPPCTEPSYRAMPWKRAKALNAAGPPHTFIALFQACFRIAQEIGCPVIVENVKGAQPWVGRAKWHYGSFYLWGDVPALMPRTAHAKHGGNRGSWFPISHGKDTGEMYGANPVRGAAIGEGIKQGGSGRAWFDKALDERRKAAAVKCGGDWFSSGEGSSLMRRHGSRTNARKEASAQIAKIPFELAYHIGSVFHPGEGTVAC